MAHHNCPNCGTQLSLQFESAKMTTCPSCDTSLFLQDTQFAKAGEKGEMHDGPTLFELGDQTQLSGLSFTIYGHARFDYGPGWWDEYWTQDAQGNGAWISVDEGEIILQRALDEDKTPSDKTAPKLGTGFTFYDQHYQVVEADRATCVALRGDFSELLHVGMAYDFVNCLAEDGSYLSGEFADDGTSWYRGVWIDPFDISTSTRV